MHWLVSREALYWHVELEVTSSLGEEIDAAFDLLMRAAYMKKGVRAATVLYLYSSTSSAFSHWRYNSDFPLIPLTIPLFWSLTTMDI